MQSFFEASAWILPVIFAVTLHEAAHGWVAERFGDNTARALGRVTFNPIKHIDRFGTIIMPGLLLLLHSPFVFGYAKPVPVDFHRLQPPRLGMFMVAIAGVAVNFLLAMFSGLLMHIDQWVTPEQAPWVFANLNNSLVINCVLIVFNMVPLLPLDGGRVVDSIIAGPPQRLYRRLERYGIPFMLLLLIVPPLLGFNLAEIVIGTPAMWLVEHVMALTGNGQIA